MGRAQFTAYLCLMIFRASFGKTSSFPGGSLFKKSTFQCRRCGLEGLLEEEMATHSSILVWEIPWTEEPGGLQSMGSQRVRHDLVTEHACTHWGDLNS